MVQNHWPAYKSQVAFEDLYWMQTSLIINSTEAYYSDVGLCMGRRLQRCHDGWPTSRQATRRAVGEEGGGVDVTADA